MAKSSNKKKSRKSSSSSKSSRQEVEENSHEQQDIEEQQQHDASDNDLINEEDDEAYGLVEEEYSTQFDGEEEEEAGVLEDVEAGDEASESDDYDDDDEKDGEKEEKKKKKKVHKLSLEKTEDFNAKLRKRGVLYIARIPPRMNPTKIKSLLSDFGTVTRVYLVEEDKSVRKRRQKQSGGGAGGKRYVEGWVEMEDKRVAKRLGLVLNNTPISNHKRNVHYGDLWNVKYLRKFQWSHLTEKVAYERRVREQKLRVEMMQARRENAAYTQLVEAGKKLDKIEERKRKRGEDTSNMVDPDRKRSFRQTKPVEESTTKAAKHAVLRGLV
mmetsp:Transcript_14805/g.20912  ORF Transcript_14805/g.20912 Transcript_14805/m.20912 type:complete len:326 (+) Transcript_14805:89-1066(+)